MTEEWRGGSSLRPRQKQPIFNLPKPVLWLLYVLVAVHGLRLVMPVQWDAYVVFYLSVIPVRLFGVGVEGSLAGGWSALASLATYQFLHADWVHLGMNAIWLAIFGSAVAQRLDGRTVSGVFRFFVFYVLCGAVGGALHAFIYAGSPVPLVGASASIAGLMGGALRFMFIRPSIWGGRNTLNGTLTGATDARVLVFAGVYVLMNILTGTTSFFGWESAGQIAWQAHIGGLFAGIALFGLFDRR